MRERLAAGAMPVRVELVLYITANSVACDRAVTAVNEVLQNYDTRGLDFRILDLAIQPEAAERDRIIFTPTLVKRSPPPNVWLLGDLSKPQVLIDLLHMCGVRPAGQR